MMSPKEMAFWRAMSPAQRRQLVADSLGPTIVIAPKVICVNGESSAWRSEAKGPTIIWTGYHWIAAPGRML